ncbi:hypothetical protein FJY63_09400, partial [Candidatus Sumerlaeota bacterium]|nr:hypothetical protein [Candidatus Sumerlaeota bacterium]
MKPSDKAFFGQMRILALAIALPFIMVVGPIAGYFVGGWIGEALGHSASGKLAGLLLGVVTALH